MKALSLYSGGCDGMSLAASWLGIETVAFCDSEEACRAVLAARHPDAPIFSSDEDVTPDGLRAVGINPAGIDLVMGGPPCQCASVAGKRLGAADPRNRWPQYIRIVRELRTRWIMAENSPGLLSVDGGRLFGDILQGLAEAGYSLCWDCWGAGDVGAPHQRDRLFILGELGNAEHDGLFAAKVGGVFDPASNHDKGGTDAAGEFAGAGRPGGDEDVANADDTERRAQRGACRGLAQRPDGLPQRQEGSGGSKCGGQGMANSECFRLPGSREHVTTGYSAAGGDREAAQPVDGGIADQRPTQPGLGRNTAGLSRWLDEAAGRLESQLWPARPGQDQYEWEPPRVAQGIPNRVPRLKIIGNACPPQQYLVGLAAIRTLHEMRGGRP